MHGAQVKPEHTPTVSGRNDLQERMSREPGLVPFVMIDRQPAEKRERLSCTAGKPGKAGRLGNTLDGGRLRRFLKYDNVGRRVADDGGDVMFPPDAAPLNVVRQDSQRRSSAGASSITR